MNDAFAQDLPVLVTGANGFIGLRLVNRLVEEGQPVRAFVLPGEAINAAMPEAVEICRGDIADPASVDQAMKGAGTVFHLASLVGDGFPDEAHARVTVGGTENILNAAVNENASVVLVSSIVVYGDAIARDVCSEDHPHGHAAGPYSRAKQQQEVIANRFAELGLKLSIVRPGNVYGPGPTPWVRDVYDKMSKGLPVLIGGGDFNAGLVYVDNVVDVLVRAARPEAVGQIYNALDGSDITWKQYFTDFSGVAGLKAPKSIPHWLASALANCGEFLWWKILRRKDAPPLTNEALALVGARHRIPIDKARNELGYVPLISHEEGMASISHYLSA